MNEVRDIVAELGKQNRILKKLVDGQEKSSGREERTIMALERIGDILKVMYNTHQQEKLFEDGSFEREQI